MRIKVTWIIIGILAIIIIFMTFRCNRKVNTTQPVAVIIRDTVKGDDVPYKIILDKPYPVYRDTGSIKWRYTDVDTSQILVNYFTMKYYHDTLKDDTSALIVLNEVIVMNEIDERNLYFQNRRPWATNITNITGEQPRNKLYVGLGLGKSIDDFFHDDIRLTASVLLTTKKRFAYELRYDIFNQDVYGTIYYKLSFNKQGSRESNIEKIKKIKAIINEK